MRSKTKSPNGASPSNRIEKITKRADRRKLLEGPAGGFVSFEIWAFLLWLFIYGWTGYLLGLELDYPVIGAFLGTLIGIFPSYLLGIGAHYGGALSFLCIPLVLILFFVPEGIKLWVAVASCILPLLAVLISLII